MKIQNRKNPSRNFWYVVKKFYGPQTLQHTVSGAPK